MRAIIQRVSQSSVVVDGEELGAIDAGIMALIGFGKGDSDAHLAPMLEKIINLRIFANEQGRFDRSLLDINGGLLLIPQFTLFADTSKGRRPEFFGSLPPQQAQPLFEQFVELAKKSLTVPIASGRFGADMKVSLVNDGPVTISLEM